MHDLRAVDDVLYMALDKLKGLLRESDFVNAKVCIDAGEPGLGLETICTQPVEYDIRIPRTTYELLANAGKMMNMPPRSWEMVLPLIDG